MTVRRLAVASVTSVALLALGAGPAMAKQLRVDDDGAQCRNADFTSIQAAVTAASPGDKVRVCAGTTQSRCGSTARTGSSSRPSGEGP